MKSEYQTPPPPPPHHPDPHIYIYEKCQSIPHPPHPLGPACLATYLPNLSVQSHLFIMQLCKSEKGKVNHIAFSFQKPILVLSIALN